MIATKPIVCGGGWKQRKDRPITFKAFACLIMFIYTLVAAADFVKPMGEWVLFIPAGLLVLTAILLAFERPQMWWGPPDARGEL